MNKIILPVIFLFTFYSLWAQDRLITTSGDERIVKVIEIDPWLVKYRAWDNLNGPLVSLLRDEVFMIRYQHGASEVITPHTHAKINPANVLAAGTMVPVELLQTLNSKTTRAGSITPFRVIHDISAGNRVVIAAGTNVTGVVSHVHQADHLGKQGSLEIIFNELETVDGQQVLLTGGLYTEGENKTIEAIGLGALVFWPILFIKGKEAEVPAGTRFFVEVAYDVPLSDPVAVNEQVD